MKNIFKITVGPINLWAMIILIFLSGLAADFTTGTRELDLIESAVDLIEETQAYIFELRTIIGELDSCNTALEAKVDSLRTELYWAQREWGGQ